MIIATHTLALLVLAQASTTSSQPPSDSRLGGTVGATAFASGGTQRQNSLGFNGAFFFEPGLQPNTVHAIFRARGESTYNTSQKPGQDKTVTVDVRYIEGLQAFDLVKHPEGAGAANAVPPRWVYGVASGYHHAAFGLDSEAAFGGGIEVTVPHAPGLIASADLRYIAERFAAAPELNAAAARLRETYTYKWTTHDGNAQRTVAVIAEAFEVTPAFGHADALQSRFYTNLTVPLIRGFNLAATYGIDYLRNAAPEHKPRFWKTTYGVNYAFGSQ